MFKKTRVGNSLFGFLSKSLFFGERPERFAHIALSLFKKEGMR